MADDKLDKRSVGAAFRDLFAAMHSGQPVPEVREGPAPPGGLAELPTSGVMDNLSAEVLLRNLIGANPSLREIKELGPFIEPGTGAERPVELREKTHVLAFPETTTRFFASLTAERIRSLSMVANLSPEIIGVLQATARREIERQITRRVWSRAWKAAAGGATAAFVIMQYGVAFVEFVFKTFPSTREVLPWLSGLAK